jgi:6,7-dimethyl-8-ribityllumazine synthase
MATVSNSDAGPVRPATARAARIVIVASRFNSGITSQLVDGARQALQAQGVAPARIQTVWVPGAFELPVAAACAAAQKPSAIIAVGCLLKGQTPQYLTIADAVAGGLTQVAVQTRIPVTFGVIVAETIDQARERAGGTAGNRGAEAAAAALATLEAVVSLTARTARRRGGVTP